EVGRHFRQNSSIQPGRNANPEASGSFTLSLPEGPLEYVDRDPGSSGGSSPCERALAFRNNTLPPDRARPKKLTSRVRRVFRRNGSDADRHENQATTSANEAMLESVAEQQTEIAEQPLYQQPMQGLDHWLLQNLAQQPTYNSVDAFLQPMTWQPTQFPVDGLQLPVSQQPTHNSVDALLQNPANQTMQGLSYDLLQAMTWKPTHNSVDGLQLPASQQLPYNWFDALLQNLAQQPLQDQAQQPTYNLVDTLQPLLQQPTHDSVNWLLQELPQEPTQESSQQPTLELSLEPTLELSLEPTQELSLELTQESSLEPTQESSLEPTQESSLEPTQESSLEPTQESSLEPTRESSLEPTRESLLEVVKNSSGGHEDRSEYTKRLNPGQVPSSNVNQADTNNQSNENELLSSDLQYELTQFATERFRSLTYKPRRAIVHQFGNMDSETVVAYGDNKLQLWNPVTKGLVGEWDGGPQNVHIGQVEPVSPSTLAIVSTGAGENERVSKAGRLHFADLNWSTENNRFSDMTVRQWVGDEPPVEDISVVEGVQSEDADDESEMSLFTGSMTDGAVYRRNFDISDGKVRMANQQNMATSHNDVISALCHVAAKKCVISDTESGSICVNDHKTGSCLQSFSLDEGGSVNSFTRCPFNPNMFMVGSCQPANKLMIFDIRENMGDGPKLVLQDAGCTITAPSNKPAWDTATGLVLAPVRRRVINMTTATIDIWDPRFVSCKDAVHFELHSDEKEVFSVDFTDTADVKKCMMVTASERSIGFTSSRYLTY
ncbi:hypothetical protein LPJ73_001792, partial [Coemansia sp. RSA 2703]